MPVRNLSTSGLAYLIEALKIQTDQCQEWPFSRNKLGYGFVFVGGKRTRVHRQAQKLTNPNFDESLKSCHRCDNPPCFNPRHLFQGTQTENMRDMDSKGRRKDYQKGFQCLQNQGQGNGNAKLDADRVREILRQYSAGKTQKSIAGGFRISRSQICLTVNRKQWTHLR